MATDVALTIIFDEGSYYYLWDTTQKEIKSLEVAITKSVQSQPPICKINFSVITFKNRNNKIDIKYHFMLSIRNIHPRIYALIEKKSSLIEIHFQ